LNIAKDEWEWIDATPFAKFKISTPKNGVVRWLLFSEEACLMPKCPDWLKEIVAFALNTGMRQGEILSLKWSQVDLERQEITVLITKNKEPRTLPINDEVQNLLKAKMATRKGSAYVFPSESGTMIGKNNLSRAFRKAVKEAGIVKFRFHDLRHTFATRLVRLGTDLYKVAKLLGHKTLAMVMRYAHLDVESLRADVAALNTSR